jgi:hypothetical protein
MDADVRNIVVGVSDMPTNEDVGGLGGECIQPTARHVRLLSRALAEGWPIPEDTRREILDRLGKVLADPQARLRAVLAAAKCLKLDHFGEVHQTSSDVIMMISHFHQNSLSISMNSE